MAAVVVAVMVEVMVEVVVYHQSIFSRIIIYTVSLMCDMSDNQEVNHSECRMQIRDRRGVRCKDAKLLLKTSLLDSSHDSKSGDDSTAARL